ncbi:hypothetical protein, partial [Rickettsia tamurae]|uniref:hypothetical protein n=1 Tax=Rickettsia tamurae TaxID=334545 RepID=UPI001F1C948D
MGALTNRFFTLLDQGLSNLIRNKSSKRSIYLIIVGTDIPRLAAISFAKVVFLTYLGPKIATAENSFKKDLISFAKKRSIIIHVNLT